MKTIWLLRGGGRPSPGTYLIRILYSECVKQDDGDYVLYVEYELIPNHAMGSES